MREDYVSTDLEGAAHLAREADAYDDPRPSHAELDDEGPRDGEPWHCAYCGTEATYDQMEGHECPNCGERNLFT